MAAKTRATTPTAVPVDVPTPVELPETTETTVTLEDLKAQRKALEEQIRQLKGATKQSGKADLAGVVAKQHELPGRWVVLGIAAQVDERVQAGQDAEEVLSQVAARYATIVQEVLATRAEGENLQAAVWKHLRDAYPRTNARTGPTKPNAAA
jgi:hypothetical protein